MSDRSVVCSPTNWCHHRYPCSTGGAQPAAPGRLSLVWAARPVDAVTCLRPSRPTANCEVIHRRGGGAIRIDGDVSQDGCYFVRRAPLAHHQERYYLRYYGASSNGSVEVLLSGCGNDVRDAREQARGLCVNRVGVRIVMKATRTIGGNRGHEVEVRDNVELLAGAVVSGDVVEVKDVISDDCCLQTVAGVGGLCGRVTAGAESQRGEEDERKPGPRHEKLRVRCGHQGLRGRGVHSKEGGGGSRTDQVLSSLRDHEVGQVCHRFLRGATSFRLQLISPRAAP